MMAVVLSVTIFPMPLKAGTEPIKTIVTAKNTADQTLANTLVARLDEIKAVDKSNLSSTEKRQLRKETRSIKKELKAISGGVYLSAGTILLILVLLIIFL